MNIIIIIIMKVLIKPRPELVNLFSKESVKNNLRQVIEPNTDLMFYDDIKNSEKEQTLNEIDILIGPKIEDNEQKLYTNLKLHQTF